MNLLVGTPDPIWKTAYDKAAAARQPTFEEYLRSGRAAAPGSNPVTPLMASGSFQRDPFTKYGPGSPFAPPMKTIGGSGIPTAGGVTQEGGAGGVMDSSGGFQMGNHGSFGFDPNGRDDRIGNVGGEFAPPSPTAEGGFDMGSLDSFLDWRRYGMPSFGSQSNGGAPGRSRGNWVTDHPSGITGEPVGPYSPFPEKDPFKTFTSYFNPTHMEHREHGGPVKAGEPYLVGEDGPEVMIPETKGTIAGNDDSGLYQTNDVARRRRQALKNGDFHGYLNALLFGNPALS